MALHNQLTGLARVELIGQVHWIGDANQKRLAAPASRGS